MQKLGSSSDWRKLNRGKILIAAAWVVSTSGALFSFSGRTMNMGFVFALGLAFAAVLSEARVHRFASVSAVRRALALGALAFVAPALVHGLSPRLGLGAARGVAALIWFALLLTVARESAKKALPWAALALIAANFVFAGVSPFLPPGSGAFEIAHHAYVGGVPRFRGFANSPSPAGVWALVSIALAEDLSDRRLRWLTRTFGLLEASATLSLPLLSVPALLAGLVPHRAARRILLLGAAVGAGTVLYFQPVALTIGGRAVYVAPPDPNYLNGGLGPKYMPELEFGGARLSVRGHATAYGKLALRGVTCFLEHPLAGVGPGRFHESCRVMAMNTFGEWTDQRDAHNQLGGTLAELGCLGVAFLIATWLTLRQRYVFGWRTRWQRAVWFALLVCTLGAEDLLTLPVLALVAVRLASRGTKERFDSDTCLADDDKGNCAPH